MLNTKLDEQYKNGALSEIPCFDYGDAMADDDVIPPKLFNQVAQAGHFAAGLAVVWGSIVLFNVQRIWIPLLALAVVTGVKEFWYDQRYETPIVRGSNFEDWLFYQIGGLIAVVSAIGALWVQGHGL